MTALLHTVCDAVLEKKGEDLISLDVGAKTILAEHFVIVSGRSNIQVRAIADAVVDAARDAGTPALRVEGYREGGWILVDLGTILIHVFTPEQRAFYNLERLWRGSPEQRATDA